jgi:two-component system, OmpR family, response regulator
MNMAKPDRPRLLIVDDNPDARDLCTLALEGVVAEMVVASSASEALEALCTFEPDVLLCDVVMPEVDGYTFINALRASKVKAWQQVPAIAVSALSEEKYQQRALAAGFQRYLVKPVDFDELIAAINEVASAKPVLQP